MSQREALSRLGSLSTSSPSHRQAAAQSAWYCGAAWAPREPPGHPSSPTRREAQKTLTSASSASTFCISRRQQKKRAIVESRKRGANDLPGIVNYQRLGLPDAGVEYLAPDWRRP